MILLLAPLFPAIIHKVKQMARGQAGIGLLQFYRNTWKLVKKEVVLSKDASFISKAAPYVVFLVYVVIIAMAPAFYSKPVLGVTSDIILTAYLMALSTFFMTLYAFDQGSSFGGLGSSREWFITVLSEPTLVFILITLAIYTGKGRLSDIFLKMTGDPSSSLSVPVVLIIVALFIIALSENARIPFDNPETHLELTMIHEANILDASGRHLALYEYASHLKLTTFLTLLSLVVFPYVAAGPGGIPLAMLIYAFKMLVLAVIVCLVEITSAKQRLFRVPNLLSVGFVLSLIAMMLLIRRG